jgi:hypothetical protein
VSDDQGMTDDLPGTLELDPGLLAAMPLDELGTLAHAPAVRYAWQLAALRELGARLAPRLAGIARWGHAHAEAYNSLPGMSLGRAAQVAAGQLGLGHEEAAELAALDAWYCLARSWSVTLQGARDALAAGGLTFGRLAPVHDDSGHEQRRAERRGAASEPGPQPGGRDHDSEGGGAGAQPGRGRRKPAAGRAPGRRPAAGH